MKLTSIQLQGFKSIDNEGQTIPFFPVTVFLGANGAGKSNLISFFNLMNAVVDGKLQNFVARAGGPSSLLYFGPKTTQEIIYKVTFSGPNAIKFSHKVGVEFSVASNVFIGAEFLLISEINADEQDCVVFSAGGQESELPNQAKHGDDPHDAKAMIQAIQSCKVYQFHDTTPTAKIRLQGYVDDAHALQSDGGNLAAFLRVMKKKEKTRPYYDRIVRHIRQVVPQFGDFDLNTLPDNDTQVRLNWREKDSDHLFGPHQLSDGTLRFMALTTLFLQPSASRPGVIVVDEPELGLHPAALGALADMAKSISHESQVVFATQSPALVDHFDADQIVVVERDPVKPRSVFKQLDAVALKDWLKRYSLSELWEKNVIGGCP